MKDWDDLGEDEKREWEECAVLVVTIRLREKYPKVRKDKFSAEQIRETVDEMTAETIAACPELEWVQ